MNGAWCIGMPNTYVLHGTVLNALEKANTAKRQAFNNNIVTLCLTERLLKTLLCIIHAKLLIITCSYYVSHNVY